MQQAYIPVRMVLVQPMTSPHLSCPEVLVVVRLEDQKPGTAGRGGGFVWATQSASQREYKAA